MSASSVPTKVPFFQSGFPQNSISVVHWKCMVEYVLKMIFIFKAHEAKRTLQILKGQYELSAICAERKTI